MIMEKSFIQGLVVINFLNIMPTYQDVLMSIIYI